MNDSGKSIFRSLVFAVFIIFISFDVYPYFLHYDNSLPIFSLDSLELSEMYFNFLYCLQVYSFTAFCSMFVGSVCLLISHLILRFCFLYKLRKPMIIYKGLIL